MNPSLRWVLCGVALVLVIPHDLRAAVIRMPPGDRRSAVYVSGNRPRHLRLGYLIQRRFPGLLKQWWIYEPRGQGGSSNRAGNATGLLLASRDASQAMSMIQTRQIGELSRKVRRKLQHGGLRQVVRAARLYSARGEIAQIEDQMFHPDVEALRDGAELHPTPVDSPNAEERVAELEAISPYFLIAFGGPLLHGELLSCARGLALNQHAGWAPELKGSSTTETALYQRQLGWVGNTVHVMDTSADSGPILRRSTATLHPDDTPGHCFMAVVAVGNKLMLEVIEAALNADELTTFPQPAVGQTVLSIDYDAVKREAVRRDFANGWLADALRMVEDF
jgi:hypothetical protein